MMVKMILLHKSLRLMFLCTEQHDQDQVHLHTDQAALVVLVVLRVIKFMYQDHSDLLQHPDITPLKTLKFIQCRRAH